jgi:hypothetical protein
LVVTGTVVVAAVVVATVVVGAVATCFELPHPARRNASTAVEMSESFTTGNVRPVA